MSRAGGRAGRPPAAVVLAAACAVVGAVPAAFFSLLGVPLLVGILLEVVLRPRRLAGDPGELLERVVLLEGCLIGVGFFVLLVTAVVRLLTNRDRLLFVVSCLR
ncbi:hypothetical protein ACI78T_11785 [Blastococcus sp. SYSU D00922]